MKTIINNNKYFIYFKKQLYKLVVVLVILSVFSNVLNIQKITAYYNDTETSNGNSFSAGMLDFILTNNTLEKVIGSEVLGEISHASVAMPEDGSLPMQYDVSTTIDALTSDNAFCTGLIVEAKLNGISKYEGPLPELVSAVTTEFGSWEFRFDLPPTVSIPNNVKCNASVLFSAWREDIVNKADSGWHDEETLNISLTSRMVVLNEIYARPNSAVAPKDREYIELYNNSNAPVDVLGWQISEIAGTTETFYPVVASDAVPGQVEPYNGASTIIPNGGFLVLEFGGDASHLNDGGDTVKLYDDTTRLLDSHIYLTIPAGKAIVRYPDGIGFWVDPEATPGATNEVSMEDLRLAGFSDEMIEEVLKLMAIKNITLLDDTENIEIPTLEIVEPVESIEPEETPLASPEEIIEEEPAEEVVETEDVVGEVVIEIPPATEPEEVVTEETEVVETPISEIIEPEVVDEVVEPTDPENSDVVEESIVTEDVVEEVTEEAPVEVVEVSVVESIVVSE